ncbi:hypothetical protein K431DRAFT_343561 [Polychaeton citri CBS 116435]|uniref:Uncharacterized protein n=1 Tax=Polychaeton citri CBS 116435 TaxID=1314669 RepID=A0A9P4QFZ3_9PEZI|nr:hypothetical protein K431DRAFT_343561 [Polychaeton citri CBS 116435]
MQYPLNCCLHPGQAISLSILHIVHSLISGAVSLLFLRVALNLNSSIMTREPPAEEKCMGLSFPGGILRNIAARRFPELRELMNSIRSLGEKYETQSLSQIRASEEYSTECRQILRTHGRDVWPTGPVPLWLVDAEVNNLGHLYPRNLSYLNDQEKLEKKFLHLMLKKAASRFNNLRETERRAERQRLQNAESKRPEVLRSEDEDEDDNDGSERLTPDLPNDSDGDSSFRPGASSFESPSVNLSDTGHNPRAKTRGRARQGADTLPRAQEAGAGSGESSAAPNLKHQNVNTYKRKMSQTNTDARKRSHMLSQNGKSLLVRLRFAPPPLNANSRPTEEHVGQAATAAGQQGSIPTGYASGPQASARCFGAPVAPMAAPTQYEEHHNGGNIMGAANTNLPSERSPDAAAFSSATPQPDPAHESQWTRDNHTDHAAHDDAEVVEITRRDFDETASPSPVCVPTTTHIDPAARPVSRQEGTGQATTQRPVYLNFSYPDNPTRTDHLSSFRTGTDLFKRPALYGPKAMRDKDIDLLTFELVAGKVNEGMIKFPHSIPKQLADAGFEYLCLATNDGPDTGALVLRVALEFST